MLSTTPTVPTSDFERRTGWAFKPEGACKGNVCIPLKDAPGEVLDLESIASQMQLPLVVDDTHGVWAIGPDSANGRVLTSVEAPDLMLPTIDGDMFQLSSLRGQKVLLLAWAPY